MQPVEAGAEPRALDASAAGIAPLRSAALSGCMNRNAAPEMVPEANRVPSSDMTSKSAVGPSMSQSGRSAFSRSFSVGENRSSPAAAPRPRKTRPLVRSTAPPVHAAPVITTPRSQP